MPDDYIRIPGYYVETHMRARPGFLIEQLSPEAYSQRMAILELARQWVDPKNPTFRLKLSLFDGTQPEIVDEPLYTGVPDNQITPQSFYNEPLTRMLREHGHSGPPHNGRQTFGLWVKDIRKSMPNYIALTSADWEWVIDKGHQTERIWENRMRWWRGKMVAYEHTLRSDSPKGFWELVEYREHRKAG